jgi:hypothetical protein
MDTQPATSDVELRIVPRARDLGGFEVRRVLPAIQRQMVGPFIFWDQMGLARFAPGTGIDVRPHPHIGLATVTYLFGGEIMHRDSLGTVVPIRPGEMNLMTAGSGIVHSERTPPALRASGHELYGIQAWVALPRAHEETAPAFEHFGADELPIAGGDGVRLRVIAGEMAGRTSPVRMPMETLYAEAVLDAGASLPIDARVAERALYLCDGEVEIGGERFAPAQLLLLRAGHAATVKAVTPARFMVLGGEPADGPRFIWWNLVSSTRERIERAKADWRSGAFAGVPGDTEFIPLPPE